jgi:hypothetical protein
LIIGLAAVPIRSTLFALTSDPVLLVVIQLLDGLSGATLGSSPRWSSQISRPGPAGSIWLRVWWALLPASAHL